MTVMGLLLVVGVVVTLRWGGIAYRPWDPEVGDGTGPGAAAPELPPSVRTTVLRYVRGVAIALVAGFWAGALVTGPAVRLIMRLLAVTAGDDAQGGITEADEVVGEIDLGGTIGLYIFGGLLPGLLSGAIYLLVRRWLPAGMLGGVVFGALHLVIAATRIDPLRPENPDFDLVGPGWLSVTTFGLACVFHGMAVAAIANRYSTELPPVVTSRAAWVRALVPLGVPALFVLFPIFAAALFVGLALTIGISRIVPTVHAARSRGALLAGRIAVSVAALVFLPGTIVDLHDVIVRDDGGAQSSARRTNGGAPSGQTPHRSFTFRRSLDVAVALHLEVDGASAAALGGAVDRRRRRREGQRGVGDGVGHLVEGVLLRLLMSSQAWW